MSSRFGFQKMDVCLLTRELAVAVHAAKIVHRELREQAERAVVGCSLQLSEGLPNDSQGMRRRYFTIARNSLYEVAAAIDLAIALGAIKPDVARDVTEKAERIRGMLVALLR